jgi:hypothetical protein
MTKKPNLSTFDIAALARSYNILAYEHELRAWAATAWPGENWIDRPKPDLHREISSLLIGQFKGECTLKAKLVDRFRTQKVTAAFEIKVGNSRADFLTINGDTRSFEIKSELDNFQKLPKQMGDYQQVFDYNYLLTDEKHLRKALRVLPPNYGLLVLRGRRLLEDRPALLNSQHDPEVQLKLFSKKELARSFQVSGPTPDEILRNFTPLEINHRFKTMLKARYAKRWQFLMRHREQINPIDYQFFFQHNITPDIIYGSC